MIRHPIKLHNYSRVAGFLLAISQLLLGGALLALQVTGIYKKNISTHLGATGIWAGAFIILCGIAGLVAAQLRTAGALLSFLVLSILSTLVCPAVVVTSTISIMELQNYCMEHENARSCASEQMVTQKWIDLALIIVAVVEYCMAASCAISCCWTLCCDPARYQVEYKDMDRLEEEQGNGYSMEMQPQYEVTIARSEP